jgi:hypothetical protein
VIDVNIENNKRLIALVGFIGAGKDTAADYLVNFHEFRRDSFASTLKDAVAAVFGWDRELLEGRTKEAREWREQIDPWWSERLNMPNLTPRWVLQHWGTEVCRNAFHNDIWIASLENKLRRSRNNTVISDCRFRNEVEAIKNQGGRVVWIQRGITPHWYDIAAKANHGDESARRWLEAEGIHASEYSWAGTQFDHVVENNGSISSLYSQLNDLLVTDLAPMERLAA